MGLLDGIITGAAQAKQSLGDISEYALTAGKGPRYWEVFNNEMRTNPAFANAVYMDVINKATPFMMTPQKFMGVGTKITQTNGIPELIRKANTMSQGEPAILNRALQYKPMGLKELGEMVVNPLDDITKFMEKRFGGKPEYLLRQNRNLGQYARGFQKFLK